MLKSRGMKLSYIPSSKQSAPCKVSYAAGGQSGPRRCGRRVGIDRRDASALLQELAAFFVNLKHFASWRALVARLFVHIEQVVICHIDFADVRLDCSCPCK